MELNEYHVYDQLTKRITAKSTFKDLVESADHGYRPTIQANENIHHFVLKKVYDDAQESRGCVMRSYPLDE